MFEGGQIVAVISILAAMTCLSLGAYVLFKNPHLMSSKIFGLLASIATLTGLADFLIITAPDGGTALAFARPLIFLSTLLSATMLYMTSYLPYERERSWLVRHRRGFAAVAIVIALVPAVTIGTVAQDQYGWWISASLPMVWWYAVIYSFYFAGIIILARRYRKEEREDVKRLILPPAAGIGVPILSAAVVVLIQASGSEVPPMLSLTILATSVCFVYGIFRQKLFILKPAEERPQTVGSVPAVGPGRGVLVETKIDTLAYRMFINELASGSPGLLITRKHPQLVREQHELQDTPILWLTTKPGPDSIDPTSISLLLHTTVKFLQRGKGSVILLDGLEYLGSYTRPGEVMQFIYGLKDAAIVNGSKLIITVDPETMGERELSLLEREMELIKQ